MDPTWIAELPVVFVSRDGRRRPGRIAVGLPVLVGEGEARCPVFLEGHDERPRSIAGADPLQALLLGVQFLGRMLHAWRSEGGRVLDPEGDDEVALEAMFGPLLRPPWDPP